jgi:hypothetical protein
VFDSHPSLIESSKIIHERVSEAQPRVRCSETAMSIIHTCYLIL